MRAYERNGVTVDQCTECRGIFLDRGELERLTSAENAWHGAAQPQQQHYQQPHQQTHQQTHQQHYQQGYSYGGYHHKKKHKSFFEELFD